jgi:hypothetical protein
LGEDNVLSDSILYTVSKIGFGLISILFFIFFLLGQVQDVDWTFALVFLGIGLYVIASWILSPKNITLENQTLFVKYRFKEIAYQVKEINSITLENLGTGTLFVHLNLNTGKIKIPAFRLNPIDKTKKESPPQGYEDRHLVSKGVCLVFNCIRS